MGSPRVTGNNFLEKIGVVDSYKKGEYVNVEVLNCTAATLIGKAINYA